MTGRKFSNRAPLRSEVGWPHLYCYHNGERGTWGGGVGEMGRMRVQESIADEGSFPIINETPASLYLLCKRTKDVSVDAADLSSE